jgi:hypothetical protein
VLTDNGGTFCVDTLFFIAGFLVTISFEATYFMFFNAKSQRTDVNVNSSIESHLINNNCFQILAAEL